VRNAVKFSDNNIDDIISKNTKYTEFGKSIAISFHDLAYIAAKFPVVAAGGLE